MILVVGSQGMLGRQICRDLKKRGISFFATSHEIDISNISVIKDFVQGKKISWIINCAAYTAVDLAESNPMEADAVNAIGSKNLANLAKDIHARLIHISTDYVFDGLQDIPYSENSCASPLNVYGKSKLSGDEYVMNSGIEYYIIRTSWLYGFEGKNFVYTILKLINSRSSIKVIDDQIGTPTFAGNLSSFILKIIFQNSSPCFTSGIYNFSDLGQCSWWEFACEIKKQAEELKLINKTDCIIEKCVTSEYPSVAKRPKYSVLSKEKIQQLTDFELDDWKHALNKFLSSPYLTTEYNPVE